MNVSLKASIWKYHEQVQKFLRSHNLDNHIFSMEEPCRNLKLFSWEHGDHWYPISDLSVYENYAVNVFQELVEFPPLEAWCSATL